MCEHPIIPMREVDLEDDHVFICIGYIHHEYYDTEIDVPKMKGRFFAGDSSFLFDTTGQGNYLDYDYYTEHKNEFEKIYDMLADEKSRKVLEAYINQRVSGSLEYLQNLRDIEEYFDSEIVDISRINTFVDCGAYIGDSYERFLKTYRNRTGREYDGRAYLWEPELDNLKALHCKYDKNEKVIIIGKGTWHTAERLSFSGSGTAGGVTAEKSETVIQVDSIDNVVKEAVDFIKMDIEGAEYQALLGAESAIKKHHPILAICVYHKRDDLIKIPNLIQMLGEGYRYYLRAYSPHSLGIILYAV